MAARDYERLAIEPFGRHLIQTGDLDPVYIALTRVDWDQDQIARWLVAYWCLYHCGSACYLSEQTGKRFWQLLISAARNDCDDSSVNSRRPPVGERWPRGHERRHFRGVAGNNAACDLADRYGEHPEQMVRHMYSDAVQGPDGARPIVPFHLVSARAQEHILFGPWIAFKIGDMLDRVLGIKVSFEEAHIFMFKDPVKAAIMLWREKHSLPEGARPKDAASQAIVIRQVVEYLEEEFYDLLAPPLDDRSIGLQEVETVLCKWKSHMNGHYPLYNDIDEIRSGLEGWGDAALEFEAVMPEGSDA